MSLNLQGTQPPHGSVEHIKVACPETLTPAPLVAGGQRGVLILLAVTGNDESWSVYRAWGAEPGAEQDLEPSF